MCRGGGVPSLWSDRIGNERNQVVAPRRMQRQRHTHLPPASPQPLWQRDSLQYPGKPLPLAWPPAGQATSCCTVLQHVAACSHIQGCRPDTQHGPGGWKDASWRGAFLWKVLLRCGPTVCLRVQHVSARAKILRVAALVKMPEWNGYAVKTDGWRRAVSCDCLAWLCRAPVRVQRSSSMRRTDRYLCACIASYDACAREGPYACMRAQGRALDSQPAETRSGA